MIYKTNVRAEDIHRVRLRFLNHDEIPLRPDRADFVLVSVHVMRGLYIIPIPQGLPAERTLPAGGRAGQKGDRFFFLLLNLKKNTIENHRGLGG